MRQSYHTHSALRPIDNIIPKLEKVRRTGQNRWTARCPAHDDRSPSLSIRELLNGQVLINCFVGCEYRKVLAAIGLSPRDLFPEMERKQTGRSARRPLRITAAWLEARILMDEYGLTQEAATAMVAYRIAQEREK